MFMHVCIIRVFVYARVCSYVCVCDVHVHAVCVRLRVVCMRVCMHMSFRVCVHSRVHLHVIQRERERPCQRPWKQRCWAGTWGRGSAEVGVCRCLHPPRPHKLEQESLELDARENFQGRGRGWMQTWEQLEKKPLRS